MNAATGITGQSTITLFLVMAQVAVPATARRGVMAGVGAGGSGNDFDTTGNWNVFLSAANTETAWDGLGVGGTVNGTQDFDLKTSSTPNGTYAIACLSIGSNSAPTLHLNGTLEGTGTARAVGSMSFGYLTVGSRFYSGAGQDFAPMRLARLLAYSGTPSTGDRATVNSYMQDQYAITVADYTGGAPAAVAGDLDHRPN